MNTSVIKSLPPLKIFYCYAKEDKVLRDELDKHLSPLRRLSHVMTWYDNDIPAGTNLPQEVNNHLNAADIILLLISPDFIHSNHCYTIMEQSLEQYIRRSVPVVPIILRPVHWKETPIGKLQVLPEEGNPITQWPDRDLAFFNVVREVRRLVSIISASRAATLYYNARYKEALSIFEQIIATDPDDIELLKIKASLLWHLDFPERSVDLWKQIVARDPNDEGSRSMLDMLLITLEYRNLRQSENDEFWGI